MERQRLLWLYLRDQPWFDAPSLRVLHFAPEEKLQSLLCSRRNLEYIGADLSSPRADILMDITRIPCPDESFDLIFCSHVLEHVLEDKEAMREMHRVLRKTGRAILQVPMGVGLDQTFEDPLVTSPTDRQRVFGQHDHVRIYGQDFIERPKNAGFKVEVVNYSAHHPDLFLRRFGLERNELLFVCGK